MAYGDGSLLEVFKKDGKSYNPKHWKIRIDMGRDPKTGERRKPWTKTVTGTKADARKVRDDKRRELEQGLKPHADKVTFREMADMYSKARREAGKVAEDTLKEDESHLRIACEFIGDLPLKAIDAQTIESLMPAIRKHRIEHGYTCTNTTLQHYYKTVNAVFRRAVRYDFLLKNPCDKVENKPEPEPVDRKSLTADEAARLLDSIDEYEAGAIVATKEKELRQQKWGVKTEERSYMTGMKDISFIEGVRIGRATGMRMCEVLNLIWHDLTGNVFTVYRSNTKTDAGFRHVTIDDYTLKSLTEWKALQKDLLASIGVTQTDKTPIVCTGSGSKANNANFRHWWDEWKAAHGFPELLFHELRHTQATLLLGNFVDIKTVQNRLGHSKASITLDYYAHAIPSNDQAAANTFANVTQGTKQARIIELKTA